MKIRIYGTEYSPEPLMMKSAKKIIEDLLLKIKMTEDEKGLPGYYLAFIIMMYFVSSSILKQTSVKQIKKILVKNQAYKDTEIFS